MSKSRCTERRKNVLQPRTLLIPKQLPIKPPRTFVHVVPEGSGLSVLYITREGGEGCRIKALEFVEIVVRRFTGGWLGTGLGKFEIYVVV